MEVDEVVRRLEPAMRNIVQFQYLGLRSIEWRK